ncbi:MULTISPECIES: cyclic nucleotide-binding domain-containing protein [Anaerolinea]|uniref:cyclic nucleotide-binding domain-containing protein n=1 Tax=Anaerolinea TaxID=233189 RepID=UPI002630120C|nr:cyclic nucleotide-binding domain-containing protein [Anaerolinea thermophila]
MALEPKEIADFLSKLVLFRGIETEKLLFLAERIEEAHFHPEEIIFEQGGDANAFYWVYRGRLQMLHASRQTRTEENLGFLDEGDAFGYDLFVAREIHRVTVQALSEVTLLRLPGRHIPDVVDALPMLIPRLQLMLDSYNLMLRTTLPWVNPEEMVYYISRKHPIFLWLRLLPLALLGLPVVAGLGLTALTLPQMLWIILFAISALIFAGILVWLIADWANDYYIITSKRVVFQERIILLYESRTESPNDQVQSTEMDTTFWGRIFGYGDVRIRTFFGSIVFNAVRMPQFVEWIVQEQVKRAQSSLRQMEMKALEETIRRRVIHPQPPAPPASKPPEPAAKPSRLQAFLADLFHLRYEQGDMIQYRTHWFILFRRTFIPGVLFLALLIAGIVLIINALQGKLANFPLAGVLGLLFILMLAALGWWLYNYLDWHNDKYLITNEQVVDINRKPLGSEERRAAPIRNILGVEYKRLGIFGLLLNFGTVYIRVGDTTLTFDDVYNPAEIQREIFHRIALRLQRERQQSAAQDRERILEVLAVYHRLKDEP